MTALPAAVARRVDHLELVEDEPEPVDLPSPKVLRRELPRSLAPFDKPWNRLDWGPLVKAPPGRKR